MLLKTKKAIALGLTVILLFTLVVGCNPQTDVSNSSSDVSTDASESTLDTSNTTDTSSEQTMPTGEQTNPTETPENIEANKAAIKRYLTGEEGNIASIYSKTYYNLVSRVESNGYFQESLTGQYDGMFLRSAGTLSQLFMETENYDEIERMLSFCLDAMTSHDMERLPQVIDQSGNLLSVDDQIDGQAHVILAWARLAKVRPNSKFIESTYEQAAKLMTRSLNPPYFMYQTGPAGAGAQALRLIFNISLEHSREGRRWQAYDLLAQSFVGSAATQMVDVARSRGDTKRAADWMNRVIALRGGIKDNLTRQAGDKLVYLEMRLPDGAGGRAFTGMGWLCLSPIPAQWEGLDRQVMRDTVELMEKKLWKTDPVTKKLKYLATEYGENGLSGNDIIGKGVGWHIDYCRQEKDYGKIVDWFAFLSEHHDDNLYMEQMSVKNGKWEIVDRGNGEQAGWWCWAIARLRAEFGLSPVPDKV